MTNNIFDKISRFGSGIGRRKVVTSIIVIATAYILFLESFPLEIMGFKTRYIITALMAYVILLRWKKQG